MNNLSVLHIDLKNKTFSSKFYPDLRPYIGGVGIASKLLFDIYPLTPVVFAVGPLNGYFPYASKTCAAFVDDSGTFIDTYVGGRLSTRLNFSGNTAVMIEGSSEDPIYISIIDKDVTFFSEDVSLDSIGIPGKRSVINNENDVLRVDNNFYFGNDSLLLKLKSMNVKGILVSATENKGISSPEKYEMLYNEILNLKSKMLVSESTNPSCSGCPLGCHKSLIGENGGNVLVHSLVGCAYSEPIYGNVSTAFSCLNNLGYDYTHEDLEALTNLVYANIIKLYEKTNSGKLETK